MPSTCPDFCVIRLCVTGISQPPSNARYPSDHRASHTSTSSGATPAPRSRDLAHGRNRTTALTNMSVKLRESQLSISLHTLAFVKKSFLAAFRVRYPAARKRSRSMNYTPPFSLRTSELVLESPTALPVNMTAWNNNSPIFLPLLPNPIVISMNSFRFTNGMNG